MITRLWSLTLLVTQLVLAYDHKIDLKRCKEETACFIRESCLTDKSDQAESQKKLVQFKDDVDKLKDSDCDVVLQIKMLYKSKLHVMMQVKSSGAEKIKIEEGIKLVQGIDQFICKPGEITGDLTNYKFEAYGKPIYEEQQMFCSFFADLFTNHYNIEAFYSLNTEKPKLVFNQNKEIEFETKGEYMWKPLIALTTCDYRKISSSTKIHPNDASLVLTEVDTTLTLQCTSLAFEKISDPKLLETSKIVCKDFIWNYDESGISKKIEEGFSVYCVEKACRQCKTEPLHLEGSDYTDFPTSTPASDANGCPTLTCTNNKWTLTGKEITVGEAKCNPTTADPSKYAWFLGESELTKAACMEKIDCGKRYGDTVDKYPKAPGCPANCKIKGLGTNELSCTDDTYEMKLTPAPGGNFSTLDCDPLTGKFRKKGDPDGSGLDFTTIECVAKKIEGGDKAPAGASAGNFFDDNKVYLLIALAVFFTIITIIAVYCMFVKKKKKKKGAAAAAKTEATSAKAKTDASTNKSTASSISSVAPDIVVDGSEGKKKSSKRSKRSKRDSRKSKKEEKKERKFELEDYQTWDNETFNKKILPNFKHCDPESQTKWVRNCLGRFYAYCNTKKTPESGTFQQFWLLVKQCADDKCENAGVWEEIFRIEFTMGYSINEKSDHLDTLRLLLIKPIELYMLEHLKKCEYNRLKDEPRHVTEMRIICICILIHTRHPDVSDFMRKLTYNEKLEVPLRMLCAACYTRERDSIGEGIIHMQYKKILSSSVVDPHVSEGWGTYMQNILFGMGGFLITVRELYQTFIFEAIYQFALQKSETEKRIFSPTDWLYAYKGACLHENSAKIALEMFMKYNSTSLLHIETLLKQKYEEGDERERAREEFKRSMKEYTLLLASLLIGEEEYKQFEPHLRFVVIFVGDQAKCEEPLDMDKIRERAINMGNMIRDRNFAKESCDCLKAIGAKIAQ